MFYLDPCLEGGPWGPWGDCSRTCVVVEFSIRWGSVTTPCQERRKILRGQARAYRLQDEDCPRITVSREKVKDALKQALEDWEGIMSSSPSLSRKTFRLEQWGTQWILQSFLLAAGLQWSGYPNMQESRPRTGASLSVKPKALAIFAFAAQGSDFSLDCWFKNPSLGLHTFSCNLCCFIFYIDVFLYNI